MADAPERIWASYRKQPEQLYAYPWPSEGQVEFQYIRADVARADAELAVAQVVEKAAWTAYRICAETRHVKLGSQAEEAILSLAPADALAEVQRLRDNLAAEEAAGAAMIRGCRVLTDDLKFRAEKAEADRDAALARVEKLREALDKVREGDVPRPTTPWRADGVASKNDRCGHGFYTYEDCAGCIEDFARAALDEDARHG